jgi:hypothetical protein
MLESAVLNIYKDRLDTNRVVTVAQWNVVWI